MLHEFWNRLRWLLRGRSHGEVDEELAFHLERHTELNVAAGMTPEEARRQALVAFGGVERTREACREERPMYRLEMLGHDLRYAVRGIRRNPVFAIAVVLTLMLGVGSLTAVFSVVDRILFRALPYGDAERLVSVGLVAPIEPREFMLGGSYYEWQDNQKPFVSMTSETGVEACDLTETNPVRLACARVENNFLPTLGVMPVLGRNFLPEEDRPNAPRVALISYALWKGRYHLDPKVIGRLMQVDGNATEIVGVLPRGFEMPRLQAADVLQPEAMDVAAQRRADPGRPMWAFARLKPGIGVEQAKAQLQPLFQYSLRLAPAPFRKEVHYTVRPLRDRQFHEVHKAAWILLGLVTAVLLIACANVASLMMARRASRYHEMAVRTALGAGRLRLLTQAMAESVVLSVAGGAAGVLLALVLLRVFVAVAPEGLPFLSAARIDLRILVFTLGVSLLCALGFGMVGGLGRVRVQALSSRNRASARGAGLRQVLVAAQMAVTLLLLAGGALLVRSFWNLQAQDLGMQAGNTVTATVSLGRKAYPTRESQRAFFERLQRELRYGPAIDAVAVSDSLPPGGPHQDQVYASIRVEGRPRLASGTGGNVAWRWVTPEYFKALGIPLVQGEGFTDAEVSSPNRFMVLSRALAARMFAEQNPLGQQVHLAAGGPANQDPVYTVVGVAADVKNGGLAAGDEPEYYRLLRNRPEDWVRDADVVVRSSLPAAKAQEWIRSQIAALDPNLPVRVTTLQERVSVLADQPRFEMLLVGYFAGIGLLLAVVGLYGVVAYLVVQHRPEMGIRMALGASRGNILRLVLGSALRMVLAGTVLGVVLALMVSRGLGSLLFEVDARDPATLVGVAVLLVAVAVMAALIPARAAAQVDPCRSLRAE